MKPIIIAQIIVAIILLYSIFSLARNERLCVKRDFGYITDVPVSAIINANMALVHDTSIGQAPLGDPRYWLGSTSPITQGQYGLYMPQDSLRSANNFNPRQAFKAAAAALPVYTEPRLPSQCVPLN